MQPMQYYKYTADFSESRDNIFVKNNMDWFIYITKQQKVVTAKRIQDHLEKMTEWTNFVSYDVSEPEKQLIDEGITRVILNIGYDHA